MISQGSRDDEPQLFARHPENPDENTCLPTQRVAFTSLRRVPEADGPHYWTFDESNTPTSEKDVQRFALRANILAMKSATGRGDNIKRGTGPNDTLQYEGSEGRPVCHLVNPLREESELNRIRVLCRSRRARGTVDPVIVDGVQNG